MLRSVTVDQLVVGAGMAGMTAAAYAARAGARVLVLEKASEIGGSAALSGGFVWTAPTLGDLQTEDPLADASLAGVLVDEFPQAVSWLRSLGSEFSAEITGIYGFGRGYQVDIPGHLDRCRSLVESRGGWVVAPARVHELARENGRVVGAWASDRERERVRIKASWTVLATGGFQADPALRVAHIHPNADRMLVRSNPHSSGDGLRLGLAAGAALTPEMTGFYGHLVPSPLREFPPAMFIPFAQLHSGFCLLLNEDGARFTDESLGDHYNTHAVVAQPEARAILVADEEIRGTHILAPYIQGMEQIDRLQVAADAGARFARAESLEGLARSVSSWGIDRQRFRRTLEEYNETVKRDPAALDPPRRKHAQALETPPYFALEVQPAITFTYGGLRVDTECRVLGHEGAIPGLLAAGVDIGGVYHRGYAGGLARGLVFGIQAAKTATAERPLVSRLPPAGP